MTFFIAPAHFFVPTVLPVASRYVVPFPELVAVPEVLPVASRYVVRFPDSVAVPYGPAGGIPVRRPVAIFGRGSRSFMRFFLLENELEELIQMGLYARFVVVGVGQIAPEVLHAVRDHGIVVSHRRVADSAVRLAGR